jgi:hypothetical protein
LEKHGLINFNVRPDEKPLSRDLLRESGYNRVFINAANKHFIQKNEQEYMHNLHETSTVAESDHNNINKDNQEPQKLVDAASLRKINLLT